MPTPRLSAKSLKNVKAFVERECTWLLVRRGQRHREYRAVCCGSPYLGRVSETDDGRCLGACMMLFKRSDGYVLSLTVNGESAGQFGCHGVLRERLVVDGLEDVAMYAVKIMSPLVPVKLGFTPYMLPPKSVAGSMGLNPAVIYANSYLVGEEEARDVKSDALSLVFGVGGVGAWIRVRGAALTLYAFALSSDLYTACCDRIMFPSLAKIYTASVGCGDDGCEGCRDPGRHVDPTAGFFGCVPDTGTCFCYMTCAGLDAPVRNPGYLPYLEADPASISRLYVKKFDGKKGLPCRASECIGARDARGAEVAVRDDTFRLVRVDPALSRLIVLACPALKMMVMQHA
ncbi:pR94 [rat cytomegalovirus strain Maastricht]|uniref:PR94 n=1 Tax=Rat cytomegalovirus (strain Maastricht) TaxID=79700 RepID=Q9DWA8_RCMVM|nr:pR94 [rat cytomegalovirus strain Maastricht]AAF99182.1 pR94 [rat cytomegalovirus strain Maastricht]WEG72015.1 tegument protein UL16 [Murid betaherpesvirus 2]